MSEAFQLSTSTPRMIQSAQENGLLVLPPSKLVTPRRYDLAVKYRFFLHLLGGNDPEAESVYRWHIEERIGPRMKLGLATDCWKRTTDDYLLAANQLCESMRRYGYQPQGAVPIDQEWELLGGAHRLACALALDIKWICARPQTKMAWAPSWGRAWFEEHGMDSETLARLDADWGLMRR